GQQIDEPRVMIGPDYADVDGDENTAEEVRLYFHADQVGSIVAVTGPDETVVEQYEYMPYGEVTIKDGQGTDLNGTSAILNPFMFTARRFDEETGLYHYRHRAYDPVAGRFLQRDPASSPPDNLYEYALSRPPVLADPLGLDPLGDGAVQVGARVAEAAEHFAGKHEWDPDSSDEVFAGGGSDDDAWQELESGLFTEDAALAMSQLWAHPNAFWMECGSAAITCVYMGMLMACIDTYSIAGGIDKFNDLFPELYIAGVYSTDRNHILEFVDPSAPGRRGDIVYFDDEPHDDIGENAVQLEDGDSSDTEFYGHGPGGNTPSGVQDRSTFEDGTKNEDGTRNRESGYGGITERSRVNPEALK
ncbi:MAG: hypothetical protein GF355_14280, partial [Candidatus Eisenbacteria bacterium]|nr:hypothetical protein [Candidatus Latescibacterota bacterium]MBD3336675.1 hypothetical protein [Candidatus Eisenbacteria bacterium]